MAKQTVVLSYTAEMYGTDTGPRCLSECLEWAAACFATVLVVVRLKRSMRPFDCGWYGVVWVFLA